MKKQGCSMLVILLGLSSSLNAASFEVFVNENTYHVRNRITLENEYQSGSAASAIQFAIDRSSMGGSVSILAGEYPLDRPLHMKSSTSLNGAGPATVLHFTSKNTQGIAVLCDSVEKVILSDFSVMGRGMGNAASGIVLDHCGDCTVKDIHCTGLSAHGIWLRNNSFLCEIRGCRVAGSGKSGIILDHLRSNGRGGDFVPNLVSNCMVYGGNEGIVCDGAIVANIIACEVYQTKGIGFYIRNQSNSVLVSGCRTFQIHDDAVVFEDSHEINITANIFCWHVGHGIVLNNATWGTVSGNNIIDNGHYQIDPEENEAWDYWVKRPDGFDFESNVKNGIYMLNGTRGITVNGNAIFNWGSNPPLKYGIEEERSCLDNLITANNINYCLHEGVMSKGENTVVVNNYSNTETPYHGSNSIESDRFHRYETKRIREFIEMLED